jgi:hypothetical protein
MTVLASKLIDDLVTRAETAETGGDALDPETRHNDGKLIARALAALPASRWAHDAVLEALERLQRRTWEQGWSWDDVTLREIVDVVLEGLADP